MQEKRLQWFVYVETREENYIAQRVEGIKGTGRPKKEEKLYVKGPKREINHGGGEVLYRTAWRRLTPLKYFSTVLI